MEGQTAMCDRSHLHRKQRKLKGFDCADCGVCTHTIGEYYMVEHDVWDQVCKRKEMLCIECFEDRLGRTLTSADFIKCPVNDVNDPDFPMWSRSDRLLNRLAACS
jgi:hypothetical protein